MADQMAVASIKAGGKSFRNADLSGLDLSRTDLSGADLSGADLSGADLRWARFTSCDFTGADLTGADLRWAIITWVDFTGAKLDGTNLFSASILDSKIDRPQTKSDVPELTKLLRILRDSGVKGIAPNSLRIAELSDGTSVIVWTKDDDAAEPIDGEEVSGEPV